jgi:hypothetical protein
MFAVPTTKGLAKGEPSVDFIWFGRLGIDNEGGDPFALCRLSSDAAPLGPAQTGSPARALAGAEPRESRQARAPKRGSQAGAGMPGLACRLVP